MSPHGINSWGRIALFVALIIGVLCSTIPLRALPWLRSLSEELMQERVVNGAPMTAVLSHDGDRICIYVKDANSVAGGDEMTANLTTEQLLLVTKVLTTGLSDAFAQKYDMMDLVVSGGDTWVWVAQPYWALMQAWIFSAFTLDSVSPQKYAQNITMVNGECPGSGSGLLGYHEGTVSDLWDDHVAATVELGNGGLDACPGLGTSGLFRASQDLRGRRVLDEMVCRPNATMGSLNDDLVGWSVLDDGLLFALIGYSVALAVAASFAFTAWAWKQATTAIRSNRERLAIMVEELQRCGRRQLANGRIMVCFPWAIAEKKLRESLAKLRQGSREDGSSGEVQRVTRAIAHNAGFAAGVQDGVIIDRIKDLWPHGGYFVMGKTSRPSQRRSIHIISYNRKINSGLTLCRAILGLSYQESQEKDDELLCSLVAVLRPDPRLNAGRSEMLHEERGGSQEGHPPGRLDVESLERESSASGSTSDSRGLLERPVTWPANNAYYSSLTKEDGDPLLCVWLLVEQIVDGILNPFLKPTNDDNEIPDDEEKGKSRRHSGGNTEEEETPEIRKGDSARVDDDDDNGAHEDGMLLGLVDLSSFQMSQGGTTYALVSLSAHAIVWFSVACLWLVPFDIFNTIAVDQDLMEADRQLGENLVLLPGAILLLLAATDAAWHFGIVADWAHLRCLSKKPKSTATGKPVMKFLRALQGLLLVATALMFAWYLCMLLLWALISLLVAGSKVLPGVLLAASGIAVVVRQRLRMQEGKDQQRRAIQAGINKSIAELNIDSSEDEAPEEANQDEPDPADEEGGEASSDEGSPDMADTVMLALKRNAKWMRWASQRRIMPFSAHLKVFVVLIGVFASLAGFAILSAVVFGVGGSELFVILIALVGIVTDVIADSQNRSVMRKAENGINKATADAVQTVASAAVDYQSHPTQSEELRFHKAIISAVNTNNSDPNEIYSIDNRSIRNIKPSIHKNRPSKVDTRLEKFVMALGAKVDDLPGKLRDILESAPERFPELEPVPTPVQNVQEVGDQEGVSRRLEDISRMLELALSKPPGDKIDEPNQEEAGQAPTETEDLNRSNPEGKEETDGEGAADKSSSDSSDAAALLPQSEMIQEILRLVRELGSRDRNQEDLTAGKGSGENGSANGAIRAALSEEILPELQNLKAAIVEITALSGTGGPGPAEFEALLIKMENAVAELSEQIQSDSSGTGDQLRAQMGDVSSILRAGVSGDASMAENDDGADGAEGDPGAAELEALLIKMKSAVAELSEQILAASNSTGDQLRALMGALCSAVRAKGKMLMEASAAGNSGVGGAEGGPGAAELEELLVTMEGALTELREQIQAASKNTGDQLRALISSLGSGLRATDSAYVEPVTAESDVADGAGGSGVAEVKDMILKINHAISDLSEKHQTASKRASDQLRAFMVDLRRFFPSGNDDTTEENKGVNGAPGGDLADAARLEALLANINGTMAELSKENHDAREQLRTITDYLINDHRGKGDTLIKTSTAPESSGANVAEGAPHAARREELLMEIHSAVSGLSEQNQAASKGIEEQLRALAAGLGSTPIETSSKAENNGANGAEGGPDAAQLKELLLKIDCSVTHLCKQHEDASKGTGEQLQKIMGELGSALRAKADTPLEPSAAETEHTSAAVAAAIKPPDDPGVGSTPGQPSGQESSLDPSPHASSALMIQEIHSAVLALKEAVLERRDDARENGPNAPDFELRAVLDSILKAVTFDATGRGSQPPIGNTGDDKGSSNPVSNGTATENSASANSRSESAGDANMEEIKRSIKSLRGEFKHMLDTLMRRDGAAEEMKSHLLELQNILGSKLMAKADIPSVAVQVLKALEESPLLAGVSSAAAEQQKALLEIQAVQRKALSGADEELVNLPEQLESLQQQFRDVSQQFVVLSREQAQALKASETTILGQVSQVQAAVLGALEGAVRNGVDFVATQLLLPTLEEIKASFIQVDEMLRRQANASALGSRADDMIVNAVHKAVMQALSHHAQIHSTKLVKKPSWPFSEPHKDALPKRDDTLAEAFIKILRMYLTPYNFAPVGNTQPWKSSASGSSSGNRPGQPQSNVGPMGGMVDYPMERTPTKNVAADQAGAHHAFDGPEPRHAAESSSSGPPSTPIHGWPAEGASDEQQQHRNRRQRVQSASRQRALERNWKERF